MATSTSSTHSFPQTVLPTDWTLANLQQHLGGIPLERIRLYPPPGMATERDVFEIRDRDGRLCELVDGILVEKAMGAYESLLAGFILQILNNYLEKHKIGFALAPDGPFRLPSKKLRLPDVSFFSWKTMGSKTFPPGRVLTMAPDLAIEVLSEGNTEAEMNQKLREYFDAGVKRVWYIDASSRSATAYRSPEQSEQFSEDATLEENDLLPGFQLSLHQLFARVERQSS